MLIAGCRSVVRVVGEVSVLREINSELRKLVQATFHSLDWSFVKSRQNFECSTEIQGVERAIDSHLTWSQ
jgi:hypothetical protein